LFDQKSLFHSAIHETVSRPKWETPEEKKARKRAVKEERQVGSFVCKLSSQPAHLDLGTTGGEEGNTAAIFSRAEGAHEDNDC